MMKDKESGVALIQVLLISTIISLMAIQFSHTSRHQVITAKNIVERENVRLESYSLLNMAIFTLLAHDLHIYENDSSYLLELQKLRTEGQYISNANNAKIKVQDIGGLLPIYHPYHPLWLKYLAGLGYDLETSKSIIQYLKDVQDEDKLSKNGFEPEMNAKGLQYLNRPFQTKTEVQNYLGIYPKLKDNVDKHIHHYGIYSVSLLESPEFIIKSVIKDSFIGGKINKQLVHSQKNTQYISDFINSVQMEDALTTFPSTFKRISIELETTDLHWTESVDVQLSGLSIPPYQLIGRE